MTVGQNDCLTALLVSLVRTASLRLNIASIARWEIKGWCQ